jgi:hypothetical protein
LIESFVSHLGITRARFDEVMERYRNPAIWKRDARGRWQIPGHLED